MEYIGNLITVGIGKESTRGLGTNSDISVTLQKTEMDFEDKSNTIQLKGSVGDTFVTNGEVSGSRYAEGKLGFDLQLNSVGVFLESLLGAVSTTDNTGSYTHEFTRTLLNTHPSLVIATNEANGNAIFNLAMIDEFTIEGSEGEVVKISVVVKSRSGKTNTAFTANFEEEQVLLFRQAMFKLANSTANLDASDEICVKSFSITFKKNLQEVFCGNSKDPQDIFNLGFEVSGNLEFLYSNTFIKDLSLNSTSQALQLKIEDVDTTLPDGTKHPLFDLVIDKVTLSNWDRNKANDELITQTVDFNAHGAIGGNGVKITINNTKSGY